MKSNTTFIFAGIMSAIIGNAYATGENTVTSKSYVDAQDAQKQDLITTSMVTTDGKEALTLPSLITYDTTNGLTGGITGILSSSDIAEDVTWWHDRTYTTDKAVPTMELMSQFTTYVEDELGQRQLGIPASGYIDFLGDNVYNDNNANVDGSWLNERVAGTGLVTRTANFGRVGERKIFEASDVSGYHADGLTQNQKDIQDISIPTVGAMMTAISSGATAALPTGTTGSVVTYNGATNGVQQFTETAIASTATHNQQTGALTNGSDIANVTLVETEIATREAKMTCAGWPESVAVADRTDANCWLWQRN